MTQTGTPSEIARGVLDTEAAASSDAAFSHPACSSVLSTASPAAALYRKFLELQYPEFLADPAMQWEKFVDTQIVAALAAQAQQPRP